MSQGPAWIPCDCGEFWCRIHDRHAFECDCPPIEEWERNKSMTFRIRYRAAHFLPHVYCALFVARGRDQTFVICGTFQVRAGEEWEALQKACAGVEFVQDENLHPRERKP